MFLNTVLLPSTGETIQRSQMCPLWRDLVVWFRLMLSEVSATEMVFALKVCTFFNVIDKRKYRRIYIYMCVCVCIYIYICSRQPLTGFSWASSVKCTLPQPSIILTLWLLQTFVLAATLIPIIAGSWVLLWKHAFKNKQLHECSFFFKIYNS
jgi:hypothetical protein